METKKIYLLYRGDAWLSTASLTLVAPFTTFEKAVDYLHKKSREYGIDRDAMAQFKSIRQTQGLEENFYCEELEVDPEPEADRRCAPGYIRVYASAPAVPCNVPFGP